jgi:hypothetical protein|tara:strand:- start:189 stop:641 length:453 start_codon:yes stop_codon:yes gene_type:complete
VTLFLVAAGKHEALGAGGEWTRAVLLTILPSFVALLDRSAKRGDFGAAEPREWRNATERCCLLPAILSCDSFCEQGAFFRILAHHGLELPEENANVSTDGSSSASTEEAVIPHGFGITRTHEMALMAATRIDLATSGDDCWPLLRVDEER